LVGDAVSIRTVVVAMEESVAVAARVPSKSMVATAREHPLQWARVLAPVNFDFSSCEWPLTVMLAASQNARVLREIRRSLGLSAKTQTQCIFDPDLYLRE
jgi:hypothetical protein